MTVNERVNNALSKVSPDDYQDILVIGVLPSGLLDIQPSIAQYPWVHWILSKTGHELWMMERKETETRIAAEAASGPVLESEEDMATVEEVEEVE